MREWQWDRAGEKRNYHVWKTGYPRNNDLRLKNGKFRLTFGSILTGRFIRIWNSLLRVVVEYLSSSVFSAAEGKAQEKKKKKGVVGENPALTKRLNE